jgi:hypothetical protein
MTIKFTRESIAAHLINCQSMEYEGGRSCAYYLHMTDEQEMLTMRYDADITFKANRDFTDYMDDEDFTRFYDDETLDNEGFSDVVNSLYEQAVEYFTELDDD